MSMDTNNEFETIPSGQLASVGGGFLNFGNFNFGSVLQQGFAGGIQSFFNALGGELSNLVMNMGQNQGVDQSQMMTSDQSQMADPSMQMASNQQMVGNQGQRMCPCSMQQRV
jgi:hypothetical protein